jgi:hypothetical protein
MWLLVLLGAWLVVGLLVALLVAALARGGSASTSDSRRPPSSLLR